MLEPILVTESGKVSLTYPTMPDFALNMDFNPVIDRYRLRGHFCLLHWQAKPVGQRRWGIYDAGADQYISQLPDRFRLLVLGQALQVDETIVKTVPTAVMYYPNSKLIRDNYYSVVPA